MSNFTACDLEDMNLEEYFHCGCSLIPAPYRTHLSVLAMREIRALRTRVVEMEDAIAHQPPETDSFYTAMAELRDYFGSGNARVRNVAGRSNVELAMEEIHALRAHVDLAMEEIHALRTRVVEMKDAIACQPEIKLVCKVKIDGMGVPDDGLRRPIDLIRDALQKLLDR